MRRTSPRSASDWRWYAERLADRSVLAEAVPVPIDDAGRFVPLAVPVGGSRRGGFLALVGRDQVNRARTALADRPGFPRLRVVWSDDPEVCDNVVWGDDPPAVPDVDASADEWAGFEADTGRFYGYSDRAIRAYLAAAEVPPD